MSASPPMTAKSFGFPAQAAPKQHPTQKEIEASLGEGMQKECALLFINLNKELEDVSVTRSPVAAIAD